MEKSKIYVKDLVLDQRITSTAFSLKEFEEKVSRQNKKYYNVKLGDKTGEIRGKVWTECMDNCAKNLNIGDIVLVSGIVQEYAGNPQIIIESIIIANDYPKDEFLETTSRDRSEMIKYLEESVNLISNKYLKELITQIWKDEYKDKFVNYPAAEYVHHGYVGGLLEHLWEMLHLASSYYDIYPEVDKDMVILGIICHDIGKLEELEFSGAVIVRNRPGKLLSHITQGVILINGFIDKIKDFPQELKEKLLHIIVSHHGSLEFGSPVVPLTLEAMVVYCVDKCSTDMHIAREMIKKDPSSVNNFTDYNKWLKRSMYKGDLISDNPIENDPFS